VENGEAFNTWCWYELNQKYGQLDLLQNQLLAYKSRLWYGRIGRNLLVCGPVIREVKPLARHVQSSDRKWRWDVDSEEGFIALLLRQQEPSGSNLTFFWTHTSVSAASQSAGVRLKVCSTSVRNTIFLQNTSAVLLDFQPQSDPIWRFLALQGHVPDVQFLDN
jgi:hypothetical protein